MALPCSTWRVLGPAARASRILADYGMRVIKVAPVAAKGAKQVDPVFHAYGAGRGTEKIRVDLKSDGGREVSGAWRAKSMLSSKAIVRALRNDWVLATSR